MEKLFFRFECGNERALSLLSELSKRRKFYYIVGNCWLYPNTLAKVQRFYGAAAIVEYGVSLIVFITLQILHRTY